jgi:hypothetical protein
MKKWIGLSVFAFSVCLLVFVSVGRTSAASGNADVIFIHGWESKQYLSSTWEDESSLLSSAQQYFAYWSQFLSAKVRVGYAPWDVKDTIVMPSADPADPRPGWMKVADRILNLINTQGYGANGIIIITHSTGGLYGDVLMSQCYLAQYNSDPNIKKYYVIWQKTIGMIQVASASGGVELANIGCDVVYGAASTPVISSILSLVFPTIQAGNPASLGATYDLQPSVARSENGASMIRVPAFMIAGNGWLAFNVCKPFLTGTSDGFVAMHSACGSNQLAAYTSCSESIGPDGELSSQTAPAANWTYHYPYMMTQSGHLSEMSPGDLDENPVQPEKEALISNYGSWSNAQSVNSSSGILFWKTYYSNIANSDTQTLAQIVTNNFNWSE